jgi:hypothetical protein
MALAKQQTWNNRIAGYGSENPEQLLANPRNWRVHPSEQQSALTGVLESVGVVQNVIVNSRSGHLVDGHLRVSLAIRANQPSIPVTYVDLSDEEEALILATLDPLAALAIADRDQLEAPAARCEHIGRGSHADAGRSGVRLRGDPAGLRAGWD